MGQLFAWGTFIIGLCAGGYTWAHSARWNLSGALMRAMRVVLSAIVALAVYSNLSFAVWAAGLPIDLGIVRNGRMAEHYWLGPITLVYAVVMWVMVKRESEKNRN